MLAGIGVDIVEHKRVYQAITRTAGLKEELFSENEISYCEKKRYPAQHFAARFAAKEAFFKALSTGKLPQIKWNEIEVETSLQGAPVLKISANAYRHFPELQNARIFLSLSHNRSQAIAFVAIELL